MKRFFLELDESIRIALEQIRVHKMRSALTMLGVIIGVVAVTLMGTAIKGIDKGFNDSMDMLGTDLLYVEKWPWGDNSANWWEIRNRPDLKPEYTQKLNEIFSDTIDSSLMIAVPTVYRNVGIKYEDKAVENVDCIGTIEDFVVTSTNSYNEGRFFTGAESDAGNNVVILGHDVAEGLFNGLSPIGKKVRIRDINYKVIGVFDRQGKFLGLQSFDNQMVIPLKSMKKWSSWNRHVSIRVKLKPGVNKENARDELIGAVRRVRGLKAEEKNDFEVNATEALEDTVGKAKGVISLAGFVIVSLSLFVGAIGIMNITFVSVKERTREIGTRRALGARRSAILKQFLVEAVLICLLGGLFGLFSAYGLFIIVGAVAPSFPVVFSVSLVVIAVFVSVVSGILAGFAPAFIASRLDPATALRHE